MKGDRHMFMPNKFYIIVGNNNFIIKKEGNDSKDTVGFQSIIPNTPFYHHLHDIDKPYITDITTKMKSLKMKKATIIMPDDCLDIEVDKRMLIEYFMLCGAKKTEVNFHCFLLNVGSNKKYISISKTTRALVMQYIADNKSLAKIYYDKEYVDMQQISLDIKNLHTDCKYDRIPVYINNINNDMDRFKSMGNMISINDMINNLCSNL